MPNPVLFVRHPSLTIFYANPAAEATLAVSRRQLVGTSLHELFADPVELMEMIGTVASRLFDAKRRDLTLERPGHEALHVHAVVGTIDFEPGCALLELLPNEQKMRSEREERLLDLTSANKELIRNLAHEIKNPLGGIRGAAQLLEFELPERALREYTQVIIKESDRLQTLVDRLLEPHRHPHIVGDVNIHEVLERVRSVVLAEFPQGLRIVRDYDASLPEFRGDKEQLIQAVLNIVHNAAHARAAHRAGQCRNHSAHAGGAPGHDRQASLQAGIGLACGGQRSWYPDDIRERIFFRWCPDGRGSGLGLTLAQTFVQQHDGLIECDSRPGLTDFRILVPLH